MSTFTIAVNAKKIFFLTIFSSASDLSIAHIFYRSAMYGGGVDKSRHVYIYDCCKRKKIFSNNIFSSASDLSIAHIFAVLRCKGGGCTDFFVPEIGADFRRRKFNSVSLALD